VAVDLLEKNIRIVFIDQDTDFKLEVLIWFLHFLKKYYTEKQVAKFLTEVEDYEEIWMETLALVLYAKRMVVKEFTKVKLSAWQLHDEIIRCSEYETYSAFKTRKFIYSRYEYTACVTMNNLSFELPATGGELLEWARELHNCMSVYVDRIKAQKMVIYGVFEKKKLLYAVEINNGNITQASGKYNKKIDMAHKQVIGNWYEKYFKETG
jgi:hypothetical protein